MSIHINAKSDMSFLFSSLGSGAANVAGSNFLGQYASIKNGSYAKLMKAYYGKNTNHSVKSMVQQNNKKYQTESKDVKALAEVQSSTDSLKESADALLQGGSKSVFNLKDITTKDENGLETTQKGYDTNAIYKAVNNFVNDYNKVVGAAGSAGGSSVENRTNSMMNATYSNRKLLGQLGITIGEDGKLSLDKDTFQKADMNTAKSLFQGSGSYGYQVSAQASLINFAADQAASRANTYTGSGAFNNAYSTGSIFNSYF